MNLPDIAGYMPKDVDGDGWVIDDATGLNLYDDAKNAIPSVPNPFAWATAKLEAVGEYGRENLPYVAGATVAMGLGMAATGGVVLVGGGFLFYELIHLLGNSKNVGRAIQAVDPAELVKAANPFGGGK